MKGERFFPVNLVRILTLCFHKWEVPCDMSISVWCFHGLLTVHYYLSTLIQALIRCYIRVIRNGDDDSVARMRAAEEALETKEKVMNALVI